MSLARTLHAALIAALLLIGAVAAPAPAGAASAASDWDRGPEASVRLIAAATGLQARHDQRLGLQIRLSDGWKTYWRAPGDAGLPVRIDWQGSRNLVGVETAWPAPTRFTLQGLTTFGYDDGVVLPLRVTVADPARPARFRAEVHYQVCKDICVPLTARLALTLPPEGGPSVFAGLIDRAEARVPAPTPARGITLERPRLASRGADLLVTATAEPPLRAPDMILETPAGVVTAAPAIRLADGGSRAQFRFAAADAAPDAPVTLTLIDGGRAVQLTDVARPPAADRSPLAAMLAAALLGGLILNLMPCVLPVLSIKLLGALSLAGEARRRVRRSFLATATGILASFLLLAAGALALKSAGVAVGWGMQFQQPAFLAALGVILVLFALNLLGAFEIALPGRWTTRLARIGAAPGQLDGLTGAFATGAFATLLATPCSAPFLGTAVGFALAGGPTQILAIFTALGAGMAAPYLVVAAWPRLATCLPRPGRWMVRLRQLMALALIATAVWLIVLIDAEAGGPAAALVTGLLGLLTLMLLLQRGLRGRARPIGVIAAALLALGSVAAPLVAGGPAPASRSAQAATGPWQAFAPEAVARHVRAGRVVLIDVTADWCLTCQVNKVVALERESVTRVLSDETVVAMRADWTRPDPEIAGYLARFQRAGIPFTVVHGPGLPDGRVLPEILTPEIVRAAVSGARRPTRP